MVAWAVAAWLAGVAWLATLVMATATTPAAAFDVSYPSGGGGGITQGAADTRYVNEVGGSGETVAGSSLTIRDGGLLVGTPSASTFSVVGGSVTIGNPATARALLHVGSGSDLPQAPQDADSVAMFSRNGPTSISLMDSLSDVEFRARCAVDICDVSTISGHQLRLGSQSITRGAIRIGEVSGWIQNAGSVETTVDHVVVGTATVRGNAFSVGGSTFAVGGGTVSVNQLVVSTGTVIRNIFMGTATVDCPNAPAAAVTMCSFTTSGASAVSQADVCFVTGEALEADLSVSFSSGTTVGNVFAMRVSNPSILAINPASQVYRYSCMRP